MLIYIFFNNKFRISIKKILYIIISMSYNINYILELKNNYDKLGLSESFNLFLIEYRKKTKDLSSIKNSSNYKQPNIIIIKTLKTLKITRMDISKRYRKLLSAIIMRGTQQHM